MAVRLTGQTIGDFRLDELIGAGTFGHVYKATQLSLGRTVAVKILEETLFTPDEFRQRFRREAELMARLDHPNIVVVYAFGQEGKLLYFAMRYVPGDTLAQRLSAGIARPEALRHLGEVAAALAYAHAQNVIHRDVKPANVILSAGRAYLSDFSLGRLLQDSTITGTGALLGTPLYMPPEQARREKSGPAGDVFSFGLIVYEVVAGNHPLRPPPGATVDKLAVVDKLARADVPPLAGAPPDLVDLVNRSLALDPEARPKAAEWERALLDATSPPAA